MPEVSNLAQCYEHLPHFFILFPVKRLERRFRDVHRSPADQQKEFKAKEKGKGKKDKGEKDQFDNQHQNQAR